MLIVNIFGGITLENYSVKRCTRCGRQLTMEEDSAFNQPTCMNCAREHVATVKSEMIKNIVISVVLMIVGIVLIRNPLGILLAGIPYSFLNALMSGIRKDIINLLLKWGTLVFTFKRKTY